jgi:eukaryotic-like serine/threonine-protein kinase
MVTREGPDPATAPTELLGPPSGPPPEEPPPDRQFWPWLVVLLVLVLAGLAAAWYATRDSGTTAGPVTVQTTVAAKPRTNPAQQQTTTAPATTTEPQTVVVPDLIGQSRDDAVRTLEAQGLTPDVRDVPSAEADGTVVSQHPAGGTSVQAEAGVLINVAHKVEPPKPSEDNGNSQGNQHDGGGAAQTPAVAAVPNVVGEDKDTAKADLENAGFHAHGEKQDTIDPTQDGLVVDQSPPGGTSAQTGSHVTIYVGRFVTD